VEIDLLDGVGDVEAGERQVLESSNEAPKLSQISNRSTRLSRDIGLHHWCKNWLTVHHANTLKDVNIVLAL
jgi:hypothetical protein